MTSFVCFTNEFEKVSLERMSGDDDDNDTVLVECGTTAGDFTMILHRSWSPHGFDRATELFKRGFYDNSHFFRVVPNFLVQFGMR